MHLIIFNKYLRIVLGRVNPWKSFTFLFVLLSNLVIATETKNSNNDIIIASELNPPFVYMNEQGDMVGTLVDKLNSILKPTNLDYKFIYTPWKRGLEELNNKKNFFIFPMTRTTEREHLYQWVQPLHTIDYELYGLKDKQPSLTIDVTTGKFTVICIEKTFMCDLAKEIGFPASSIIAMSSSSLNHSITMVLRERVDFILLSKEGRKYFKKTLAIQGAELVKINNYKVKVVEYLVSSHNADKTLTKKILDSVNHQKLIK